MAERVQLDEETGLPVIKSKSKNGKLQMLPHFVIHVNDAS